MKFFLVDQVEVDPEAERKFLVPAMERPFERLISALESLESFDEKASRGSFERWRRTWDSSSATLPNPFGWP